MFRLGPLPYGVDNLDRLDREVTFLATSFSSLSSSNFEVQSFSMTKIAYSISYPKLHAL